MEGVDYINSNPSYVKAALNDLVLKAVVLSKLIQSPSKLHYAHFHENPTMYARSEKVPSKTVAGFDYTNSMSYNIKM